MHFIMLFITVVLKLEVHQLKFLLHAQLLPYCLSQPASKDSNFLVPSDKNIVIATSLLLPTPNKCDIC